MTQLGYDRFTFPRLIRWYGNDFISALAIIPFINIIAMTIFWIAQFGESRKTPIMTNKLPPVLMGIGLWQAWGVEKQQALERAAPFDWGDMAAYGLGYSCAVLAHHLIQRWAWRQLEKEVKTSGFAPA